MDYLAIDRRTELSRKTHTTCFSNQNFWPVQGAVIAMIDIIPYKDLIVGDK